MNQPRGTFTVSLAQLEQLSTQNRSADAQLASTRQQAAVVQEQVAEFTALLKEKGCEFLRRRLDYHFALSEELVALEHGRTSHVFSELEQATRELVRYLPQGARGLADSCSGGKAPTAGGERT